jgi:hypothetical protein
MDPRRAFLYELVELCRRHGVTTLRGWDGGDLQAFRSTGSECDDDELWLWYIRIDQGNGLHAQGVDLDVEVRPTDGRSFYEEWRPSGRTLESRVAELEARVPPLVEPDPELMRGLKLFFG